MQNKTTFEHSGITIVFKKSLRISMFYSRLNAALVPDESLDDVGEREQFAWIAAHIESVTGIGWKPPQMTGSAKQWEQCYQDFLDAVPGYEFFNAASVALGQLRAPVADAIQKRDADLTDDERADPK
jgi:hypothetical protein